VFDDKIRERPRIGLHSLSGAHDAIGLIVAKFWSLRLPDYGVWVFNAGGQHCLMKRLGKEVLDIHGAPELRIKSL
jgi:hypothetical protein